eukprot:2091934-Rhodomonas_salina.3
MAESTRAHKLGHQRQAWPTRYRRRIMIALASVGHIAYRTWNQYNLGPRTSSSPRSLLAAPLPARNTRSVSTRSEQTLCQIRALCSMRGDRSRTRRCHLLDVLDCYDHHIRPALPVDLRGFGEVSHELPAGRVGSVTGSACERTNVRSNRRPGLPANSETEDGRRWWTGGEECVRTGRRALTDQGTGGGGCRRDAREGSTLM